MKLVLVRHAQTPANTQRVWHGHTDTPLTDLGYQQIDALGQSFHKVMTPDVIYSSPLQRTRLTAEAIAKPFDKDVITDDRLIEFGIGDWEGLGFEKLVDEFRYIPQMLEDEHHRAPNGESRYEVTQRIITVIEELATKHQDENIAIVTHGMAMSLALVTWFGNEESHWMSFTPDNTAVTEISLNPHELISFNKVEHMDEELRKRSDLFSDKKKKEA